MRILNVKLWYAILSALPLLVSCTDTDEDQSQMDSPISFTATTTQWEDGNITNMWVNLNDRRIAVRMDGTVKEYQVIDAQGNMTSSEPFLWNGRALVTVDAWYPFNDGERMETVLVKADQSVAANYDASNLIEVSQSEVKVEEPKLTFTRRTAKLICNLVFSTDNSHIKLTVSGVTGVEGGGDAVVMNENCEALLAPQLIAAGTLSVKLVTDDQHLAECRVPEEIEIRAGRCHYIQVNVDENYVTTATYVGSSANWNNSGSEEEVEGGNPDVKPGTGTTGWDSLGVGEETEGGSPDVKPGTGTTGWDSPGVGEETEGGSPDVKPGTGTIDWGNMKDENIAGNSPTIGGSKPNTGSWGTPQEESLTGTKKEPVVNNKNK